MFHLWLHQLHLRPLFYDRNSDAGRSSRSTWGKSAKTVDFATAPISPANSSGGAIVPEEEHAAEGEGEGMGMHFQTNRGRICLGGQNPHLQIAVLYHIHILSTRQESFLWQKGPNDLESTIKIRKSFIFHFRNE